MSRRGRPRARPAPSERDAAQGEARAVQGAFEIDGSSMASGCRHFKAVLSHTRDGATQVPGRRRG